MGSKHRPDWTLVSYADTPHEIWQNRYGQLAMKTAAGTWKPQTLSSAYGEITLAARIKTAIMLLGLTMREAADMVGCTQPQLVDWYSGKRYPRLQNETKLRTRLVIPAMRLELGQSHSLMQGLEVMDD
nr:MAG TPA: LAMBDA REPRESSOR (TRIPLE MUTANT)/DNA COMPLEX-DNA COMPLEX, DOUBLE HELIX, TRANSCRIPTION-DNA.1A [Caudoviricetes sp.]